MGVGCGGCGICLHGLCGLCRVGVFLGFRFWYGGCYGLCGVGGFDWHLRVGLLVSGAGVVLRGVGYVVGCCLEGGGVLASRLRLVVALEGWVVLVWVVCRWISVC